MSNRRGPAITARLVKTMLFVTMMSCWALSGEGTAATSVNQEEAIAAIVAKWQPEAVSFGLPEAWEQEFVF